MRLLLFKEFLFIENLMLNTVRENLKGTLVFIVIIIFIVPMVIGGVGSSDFLGSVAGNDAASVNGESVSNIDLSRAIQMQRNRMTAQGRLDASSPFLTDEYLREPILGNLTRRMALVTQAEDSGMAVSASKFANELRSQTDFYTGKEFDQQKYRSILARAQFTPASYKLQVSRDLILGQQTYGMQTSSFTTNLELAQLVKLTHQKRSFFSIKVPRDRVSSDIQVADDEIVGFYDSHQDDYRVEEKIKIEYIELSTSELASRFTVDEQDIVDQYSAETANFSSDATYTVAHILIEGENPEKVLELSSKLSSGEPFDSLVTSYSDDIATSAQNGLLGILTEGMFPKEFEEAVYQLEQGQISEAVSTEIGTHFIKVVEKSTPNIPSLDERRDAIAKAIAESKAQEEYAVLVDNLGDFTFSAVDLTSASNKLGLTIKTSEYFGRSNGVGIASNSSIRNAAFDDEVLVSGNNSTVIEISPSSSIVLRIAERKPAFVKPLEEVRASVETALRDTKIDDALASLAETLKVSLKSGNDPQSFAASEGVEFASHELVKRGDIAVDSESLNLAFEQVKSTEGTVVYAGQKSADAGYLVVGLLAVVDGTVDQLEASEKEAFIAQLARESAGFESAAFESNTVEIASIKVK